MSKYHMTKKAIEMELYNDQELIKLRDITLDKYLSDQDINQVEYDELKSMIAVALAV